MSDPQTLLVAVASADDYGLDGEVSPHFGRCPYYTVAEIAGAEILAERVVPNPNVARHQPGAMPHFIKGLGVGAIIAGGMGPRAITLFESLGIDVATGAQGRVRSAVEAYAAGGLSGTVPCKEHGHDDCGQHGKSRETSGIVALSARGPARGLDAELDPRFGRAERFVFVESATGKVVEEIDNPAGAQAHGAGPAASSIVAGRGATSVLSGHFGPSAQQALVALGVSTIEAADGGTLRHCLEGVFGAGWGSGHSS